MFGRRIAIAGVVLGFSAGLSGCIGSSDIAGLTGSTTSDPNSATSNASNNGSGAVATALESLLSNAGGSTSATSQPSKPSKKDIIVRVLDLLVSSSNPSSTEQVAWDVASSALTKGKKGLRDSLTTMLFSPLAEGFVKNLTSGSGSGSSSGN